MKSEALEDAQLHPWPASLEKPGAAPLSVTTENVSDCWCALALGGEGVRNARISTDHLPLRCGPFLTSAAPENHLCFQTPCLGLGPAWEARNRLG